MRARVNGDLQLEFEDVALTSYAGLELFARYLRRTRFNTMVREAFAVVEPVGTPWYLICGLEKYWMVSPGS